MIEHVVEAARDFPEILVVGKFPDKFRHIKGIKVIPEAFTGFSPIYGIVTGLKFASNDRVLFLPGDVPFVKAEVLKAFSEEIPPAVVSEREELHSLFFLISKVQLYIVEKFLKSGKHRISKLHELLKSKKVDFKRFELLDYQRRSLINLNRMEEFYETVCGQTD